MKYLGLFLLSMLVVSCASKALRQPDGSDDKSASTPFKKCLEDPERLAARSSELQEIVKADQLARQGAAESIDWNLLQRADEARAKRVAEIFAEGCFKTAQDYSAAAMVFQHGQVPDHYYQAYLWSKKAVELGDVSQKSMVASAVDRYLINLGYKQLFGAQYFRNPEGCRCIAEVESRFTDQQRLKISGESLQGRRGFLREGNKDKPSCEKVVFCSQGLKSPPKGILPGIW